LAGSAQPESGLRRPTSGKSAAVVERRRKKKYFIGCIHLYWLALAYIGMGLFGLVGEVFEGFCFRAPCPPREQKRPEARVYPTLAGNQSGKPFHMGASALHQCHITTLIWEYN